MSSEFDVLAFKHLKDQKYDFLNVFSKFSNSKFHRQTDGLLEVFPHLKRPLDFYFKGSFLHYNWVYHLVNLSRRVLAIDARGDLDNCSIEDILDLKAKHENLSCVKDKYVGVMNDFHKRLFDVLDEYQTHVKLNKKDYLESLKKGDLSYIDSDPFGGALYTQLRGILINDDLISIVLNKVTSRAELEYLDSAHWSIFEACLDFLPVGVPCGEYFTGVIDESRRLFEGGVYDFDFINKFVSTKTFSSVDLMNPDFGGLNFFKEQHHDAWSEFKAKKYFK
ncbi:MAG: hypothetical protein ACLFN8_01370 [Candidatus Woesearchaeota archaeon]